MFLDPAEFPWTRTLEASSALIRDEFAALDRRRLVLWPERGVYNHGWEVTRGVEPRQPYAVVLLLDFVRPARRSTPTSPAARN